MIYSLPPPGQTLQLFERITGNTTNPKWTIVGLEPINFPMEAPHAELTTNKGAYIYRFNIDLVPRLFFQDGSPGDYFGIDITSTPMIVCNDDFMKNARQGFRPTENGYRSDTEYFKEVDAFMLSLLETSISNHYWNNSSNLKVIK